MNKKINIKNNCTVKEFLDKFTEKETIAYICITDITNNKSNRFIGELSSNIPENYLELKVKEVNIYTKLEKTYLGIVCYKERRLYAKDYIELKTIKEKILNCIDKISLSNSEEDIDKICTDIYNLVDSYKNKYIDINFFNNEERK